MISEHLNTRFADVNWVCSKPAALDFTVVSPLHIGVTAALTSNGQSSECNWLYIPMAVKVYGSWGQAEATERRKHTSLGASSSGNLLVRNPCNLHSTPRPQSQAARAILLELYIHHSLCV